jgi:predicted XRE-type DNA-binding protein
MEKYTQKDGRRLFEEDRARLFADSEFRAIYAQEAAKKELWLQLVEARQAAGLTQAEVAERMGVTQSQVARVEKQGYENYSLRTLRRYLEAVGGELEVTIRPRYAVSHSH